MFFGAVGLVNTAPKNQAKTGVSLIKTKLELTLIILNYPHVRERNKNNMKNAKLKTVMVAQEYNPDYWDWTDEEKKALGSADDTGRVIIKRLKNAGIEISDAYAITHNLDERELWDEYSSQYIKSLSSSHIHFLAKLKDGATLDALAQIIGIKKEYIEKPKAGRFGFDNSLSYLTHIKYPMKFQYKPQDVITFCGRNYMDIYAERRAAWMQGRAAKIMKDANIGYNEVKMLIMDGEITKNELFIDPKYKYVIQLHGDEIMKLFASHEAYERYRNKLLKEGGNKDEIN